MLGTKWKVIGSLAELLLEETEIVLLVPWLFSQVSWYKTVRLTPE
jgi:hypothetical protein